MEKKDHWKALLWLSVYSILSVVPVSVSYVMHVLQSLFSVIFRRTAVPIFVADVKCCEDLLLFV